MSQVKLQQLREATGLMSWRHEPSGSDRIETYIIDIGALKKDTDGMAALSGWLDIINYFYDAAYGEGIRVNDWRQHPERYEGVVEAPKYSKDMSVMKAATLIDGPLEGGRDGGINAPWGEVGDYISVSGSKTDHPVLSIRGDDLTDQFLDYLKEFKASREIFEQIGDGLGKPKS
jgi:hypothetical protein